MPRTASPFVGGQGTNRARGTPGTVPANAEPAFPAESVPTAVQGFNPSIFGSLGERKASFGQRFKQRFPGLFGLR
jgi:hypothetical protein